MYIILTQDLQNENARLRIENKMNKYDLKTKDTYDQNSIKLLPRTAQTDNKDEWFEILRNTGISPEELDRLAKNELFSHLVEAIELLTRLLIDKNLHIRLLEKENDALNSKNEILNKVNNDLINTNNEYKSKLDNHIQSNNIQEEEYQVNTNNIESQ
jgi:hypothetical protein